MPHALAQDVTQGAGPTRLGERSLTSSLATLAGAFAESDGARHRQLLVLRFALTNLIATALLLAAWLQGWVHQVVLGDRTHLVLIITLVFIGGLIECGRRVVETSRELDAVKDQASRPSRRVRGYLETVRGRDSQSRAILCSALKLKLSARITPVRNAANTLVFLGLIGTVIGFIIALSGVDPATVAEIDAIGPMVSTLIGGMSVALNTTLVGAILNVWLMANYRLLEGGTIRLLTATVERGERDA